MAWVCVWVWWTLISQRPVGYNKSVVVVVPECHQVQNKEVIKSKAKKDQIRLTDNSFLSQTHLQKSEMPIKKQKVNRFVKIFRIL